MGPSADAFRKRHEIEGSTEGEQINYQVKIKAYYNGWQSFQKDDFKAPSNISEIALYEDEKVILPYQTGAPANEIRIKVYNATTFAEEHDYLVGADPIPADAHGCPAIRKWGSYYVLIYGAHTSATLKVSYSTNLINWTTYAFPLAGNFTYPQTFIWGDGNLYLFLRVGAAPATWKLYRCTDITNSGTWSLVSTVINEGGIWTPYATSRVVNDGDRLQLIWGRHDGAHHEDLMYAYTDDLSNWYDADEGAVALPLNKVQCLLTTLADTLRMGQGESDGTTIWILPQFMGVANSLLVKKVIGGALTTHDVGIEGTGGELFIHSGFIRIYVGSTVEGRQQVRRYKFEDSTFTLEQAYPVPDCSIIYLNNRRIYGKTDWIYAPIVDAATPNTNVNSIVFCTDTAISDSGEEVNLLGKCRTDFGDIRFRQGVTELDYWLQEKTDSSHAIFWVEVPTIPADPESTTIHIYYGKDDATTVSSGADTFDFFDDFADNDISDWAATGDTAKISVAGGVVTIADPDDETVITIAITDIARYKLYARIQIDGVGYTLVKTYDGGFLAADTNLQSGYGSDNTGENIGWYDGAAWQTGLHSGAKRR